MPGRFGVDAPDASDYPEWYEEKFAEDLFGSKVSNWYQDETDLGRLEFEKTEFWQLMLVNLERWERSFQATNQGYSLLASRPSEDIAVKPLDSVVDKSYRWNVLDNPDFPDPPSTKRRASTAPREGRLDRDEKSHWFGPVNWFSDFPDIFRARLLAVYFDGVQFLADNIKDLASRHSSRDPDLEMKASHAGYHAAHIGVFHEMLFRESEYGDRLSVHFQMEVQVITSIQNMIMGMLHDVYAGSRSEKTSSNWEWDLNSPEFSVNYLGNTLHYLEGMIVIARDRSRSV